MPRETLVLDLEISPESMLASAESARSMAANSISGVMGGQPGMMGGGAMADRMSAGFGGMFGMMPGGGYGTPAAGVPNYGFFGGASGSPGWANTTAPGGAIPQSTGGQFLGASFPSAFAPSNMPPQFFGAAMQTQFQERMGYGLAQGALGMGAGALQMAGSGLGAMAGSVGGAALGQAIGGEAGGYWGGMLGMGLGSALGGGVGELLGMPLNLASERLGTERNITNTFRSQGFRAGLGPGVARELQPTLRNLGETIAEASGTEGTPFYDPGAIARGEDPAVRAGQMTQMALESGALGRGLSYQDPGKLLGKLGQFNETTMMAEREMGLSLPEAGGMIGGLRRAGVTDMDEIRRTIATQAGINYTGLAEPGSSGMEQMQGLLQGSSQARGMGVPGALGVDITQREYARIGAAMATGHLPEENVRMLGGQMGAAQQLAGVTEQGLSEGSPLGPGNLLLQASMTKEGAVDIEKARKLAGAPIETLVRAAQQNMMASGMNPTEFLGLMEYNKPAMAQELNEASPGIFEKGQEGALRNMASLFQRVGGKDVGPDGPSVGYLQQAAKQLGMSSEQARAFIGNMNQETEGITGGMAGYTEGIEKGAKGMYEGDLGSAWGRAKEEARKMGANLARPLERAGEDLAGEALKAMSGAGVVTELVSVLKTLVDVMRKGGGLPSSGFGTPRVSVGSSMTGGR